MTKKIASIYYYKSARITRDAYNGVFELQVVPKGAPPFILEVRDHYQMVESTFGAPKGIDGRPRRTRETITGEAIAADLISHWTSGQHLGPVLGGSNPQCRPGIWIVRDTVPLCGEDGQPIVNADGAQEFRAATKEECDQMFKEDLRENEAVQRTWGQKQIDLGQGMSDDPKKIPWIPEFCRIAAVYYGHNPFWLSRPADADVKQCPVCSKSISVRALKCPFCTEVVDPKAYALHRAEVKRAEQEVKSVA